MSISRYENYKDSGIDWLGEVPKHWELKRVRYLIREGYDGLKIGPFGSQLTSQMLEVSGYKVFGQENVIANDFIRGSRYISEEKFKELSVYEIRPGDLLITMMGTSGRCAIVPRNIAPGIMDSHLLRMRVSEDVHQSFLCLLIDESAYVAHQIQIFGKGSIMHGLNSSIIKELICVVPLIEEQVSILSFLDHETAKIDALIADQQRLIALLVEKRQVVILHAVTKGLDPDVPMKDSGIEWLGEVPEHWAIPPLYCRYLCDLGKMLDSARITGEHLTPYLRNVDVQWGVVNLDDLPTMDIKPNERDRYTVQNGDLLVCEGGEVGRTAIVQNIVGTIGYQKALHRLRAFACDEYPTYMFFTLKSAAQQGAFSGEGQATIAHLTGEQLRKYRFPKPPLSEQQEIAEYLSTETTKFDTMIAEIEHAIVLLHERRTALISAAVTGKIDVRGLVAAHPECEAAA